MKGREVPIAADRSQVRKNGKVKPNCPECHRPGKQIDITEGDFRGFRKRFTEDGVFHSHDPNPLTIGYRCPKDHEWWQEEVRKCPAGDYP